MVEKRRERNMQRNCRTTINKLTATGEYWIREVDQSDGQFTAYENYFLHFTKSYYHGSVSLPHTHHPTELKCKNSDE
jgi:hypothetical protein